MALPGTVFLTLSIVFAILSIFIAKDPLQLSLSSTFPDLDIKPVHLHSLSNNNSFNLRDDENRLHKNGRIAAVVDGATGPESLAFDPLGRGPYTGVSDGTILRWEPSNNTWTHFALTSPNRLKVCDERTDRVARPELEHLCGRPLGMRFCKKTGELYVSDAYFGLLTVPPEGGLAKKVADSADGVPFKFTNDLDFDQDSAVYFTDSSSVFHRRHFMISILSGDSTGRLMKYDPNSGSVTVLLNGLKFANGVAMSKDFSFLLVSETTSCRILKYWLKGPKKGSWEVFALLPGFPDNVRRNSKGEFWVALHCRRNFGSELLLSYKWFLRALLRLPVSIKQLHYIFTGGSQRATVIHFSEDGKILDVLEDEHGSTVKMISEIEEHKGELWMGSVIFPSITVYPLSS